MTLSCPALADENVQSIRGGYAATANRDYNQVLLDAGLNSAFWAIRLAPAMELKLDEAGRVYWAGIDPAMEKGLRKYAHDSQEQGLDLYAKVGLYPKYIEQLKALGPYHHAWAQGPVRYLSVGEKAAPGPLEEKYWLGQLLCEAQYIAKLSLEYPNIRGFSVDVEMYAGNIMWRNNSSFDDPTFFTALKLIDSGQNTRLALAAKKVGKQERYQWLKQQDILESYFDAQSHLVEQIAVRFRQAVHAINPRLRIGFLPYEQNWFYDGWARGLGTPQLPVLVCSESEYSDGITPSSIGRASRLKELGISAQYLPGLSFKRLSPAQFGNQVNLANKHFNGYWIFTTYSLWQPKPEKLWGPYALQADRHQYISAMANANAATGNEGTSMYHHSDKLLTNNAHYPGSIGSPANLVTVKYSVAPDVPFYDDPQKVKLFDGMEQHAAGTVAWYAEHNEKIVVDIDLGRATQIQRLLLVAGHTLAEHPRVTAGTLTISSSEDGQLYYPLPALKLVDGSDVRKESLLHEDLGIKARYVRIEMETVKSGRPYSVWAISELAVWGNDPPPR